MAKEEKYIRELMEVMQKVSKDKTLLNPQHVEAFLRDVRAAAILVRPTLRITASPDEADAFWNPRAQAKQNTW